MFIPLNFAIRYCSLNLKFKTTHYFSALIIFIAIMVSLGDFSQPYYINIQDVENPYPKYVAVFLLASCTDIISHAIKENTVRSQAVD
jgi:hypothetical protein